MLFRSVLDTHIDSEIKNEIKEKALNESVIRIKTNSIQKQLENEQDFSRLVELKREEERIQKIDIFGRAD